MQTILMLIIVIGIAIVIYLLSFKRNDQVKDKSEEKLNVVMERLSVLSEQNNNLMRQNSDLRQELDKKLSETHRATQENLINSSRSMQGMHRESVKQISQITEKLAKLESTNQQVVSFSEHLKKLQDVLQNPKQRGVLGEYYLETVLQNVLPPESYKMQYAFENNEIVDAVVFVKDKIVPIDSKFSLENYNRMIEAEGAERIALEKQFVNDLKLRIKETSKYILPSQKTTDFAFMFIPSEGIYYDLLTNKVGDNNESLIEKAARQYKVIIVSPTSFLAYLQTVLQGLRAMQIEESAKEIRKNVEKLSKHLVSYDEYMKKMGNSLGTTVNHYNRAYKEFNKIDKDVVKITEGEKQIEPMILEKPKGD